MTNETITLVLDPTHFGVNLPKIDELLGRGQATREDPYGEFSDIEPVTITTAGLLLREAHAALDAANTAFIKADAARAVANNERTAAQEELHRAEHRLKISALQPNGSEE